MSALKQVLILAWARQCEAALQKAARADAQGQRDIANSWRAMAKYQARQAFKVVRS